MFQNMLRGKTLVLVTEDMPPEAKRDQESRRFYGIKSSVVIPLLTGGGPLIGVLDFDTLKEERSWSEPLVTRLHLVAQIFANALERKRYEQAQRQSEARLSLAADSAEAGLWELDCSSRLFWTNEQALKSVFIAAQQVASTDATVLILGETGTGKGMVANAIHQMSVRKDRPLITVNCSALPQNLIESELFGREKGAFTGAHARQAGRFEVADAGTIFLDEIGEMPLELQSKLLRVLQEGEFERLGSAKTVKVNARVIAATSRDLKHEVRERRFREDLYYRLNVFPIQIPPLRQRTEDIPLLAQFFTEKYARKVGKKIDSIPKAAIKSFLSYDWPGNVRELEHVIERAVIMTSGSSLKVAGQLKSSLRVDSRDKPLKDLAAAEREHILKVLRDTGWRIEGPSGAAAILKIHPSTLRFRIKKLGIRRPL
ncbi:MAG: sigma 54-interacting transcriptional regulator [Deltaproteobacteria bacterium]|nr:sigma 54-interacting transcriptional regulator [Deltaproteobacteria bacterium]